MRSIYYLLIVVKFIEYSKCSEQCLSNQWPPKLQITIPTFIIDLDAPPLVRWNEIASVYKTQIQDVLTYLKSFISNELPILIPFFNIILTKLNTIPIPYAEELKGISQITEIPLGEIILYNIFYEFSALCTSIIAQDLNGTVFHARNLDFGLFLGWDRVNKTWIMTNKLRQLVILVNYTKNGQVLFQTTSFAGFIGTLTGIKSNIFSITINTRFDFFNGGFIGIIEWIYNINRQQSFVTFAARDILTQANSYDQVVEYLSQIYLVAPCYYIIAGSKSNQGVIISRSRKQSINIKRLDSQNQWYLIQTNYDHWHQQPSFDDRFTSANRCIQTKGRANITFESLFNLLSSRPMLNKLTIYTSLIQSRTNQFQSFIQNCNDQESLCSLW